MQHKALELEIPLCVWFLVMLMHMQRKPNLSEPEQGGVKVGDEVEEWGWWGGLAVWEDGGVRAGLSMAKGDHCPHPPTPRFGHKLML